MGRKLFFGRKLLIERGFQLKLIVKMTMVVVSGTALTGALLYLIANREFGRAFFSAHYSAQSSWELLLPAVLVSSFVAMCFVAAGSTVITLYDTNRIGGPLYRFKLILSEIGRGDLTINTRIRSGDELQSFRGALNEMTEELRARVVNISKRANTLAVIVAILPPEGGELDPAATARLKDEVAELRAAVDAFKVS